MALRSMTGFGRATTSVAGQTLVVEVKSVNHKGLDVKLRLPRLLSSLEPALIQQVRGRLERGRVDVSIEISTQGAKGDVVDLDRVAALVDAARALAERWPHLGAGLTAGEVLRLPGVLRELEAPASDALVVATASTMAKALDALDEARAREGEGLHKDLVARRARMGELVDDIARRTASAVDEKRAKLKERLTALLGELLDPARLAAEAAVLAERIDVAEELARLRMHLAHLDDLLRDPSPGRKLDFLCQELLREANTTASKCQDAETAQRVVDLKAEIERLREQAQNVE